MSHDPIASLDPELREPVREMMGEFVVLDDIPAARLAMKSLMEAKAAATSVLDQVEVEERSAPGPEGAPDVILTIIRPKNRERPLPALLWMHGGGYVMGCAAEDEAACARMAAEADCITVAVEYRLAPENPFPAALEDCYAALRWMVTAADELGIDPSLIAIGGGSAGGGLAAGLALLARDRGEMDVVFQLLIYPMLDDTNVGPADDPRPDALLWTRANNLVGWRSYLGCEPGGEGISCYASAPRAADLKGLPPAYISVGDLDLFAQEDIAYADRLIQAGVPTELHVYPGGCHGFDLIVPQADISARFTSDMLCALQRALHPPADRMAARKAPGLPLTHEDTNLEDMHMDESLAEKVQWLVDRAQISELLHSFARSLDTKDAAGYVNNYADGGILELPDPTSSTGEVVTISRDQMMEFVQKGLMDSYGGTHHMSSNHQITVTGDTALSRSYLQAVHVRESPFDHWDAGGWYDCSYVRTPQGWKFSSVKLTAVWMAGRPDGGVTAE